MSLEDYTIGEKLGSGSFGQVYRILRKSDGRQFALKVIPSVSAGIDGLTEADVLFRVLHPNILHGEAMIFTDPENRLHLKDKYNLMLVLDLAMADMLTIIQQNLPLATRIRFCWECATAIKMLQDNSIHHLDVKPENVFVFGTPEAPTSKLGDFGLVCYGTPEGCLLSIPAFTPSYSPPEELVITRPSEVNTILTETYPFPSEIPWFDINIAQNEGRHQYTSRSIIWSLGAYFYFVLTGHIAFNSFWMTGLAHDIVNKLFTSEDARLKFFGLLPSASAVALIESMLKYQPMDRPTIETVLTHDFFVQAGYTQIVPGLTLESKIPSTFPSINDAIPSIWRFATQREINRVNVFFLAVDILYRVIDALAKTYTLDEIIAGSCLIAANCFLTYGLDRFENISPEKLMAVEANILKEIQGIIYRPNIYTVAWSAWSLQQLAPLIQKSHEYLSIDMSLLAAKLALLEPTSEKEHRQSKNIPATTLTLTASTFLDQILNNPA